MTSSVLGVAAPSPSSLARHSVAERYAPIVTTVLVLVAIWYVAVPLALPYLLVHLSATWWSFVTAGARALALGADWCNSARGFMFALGCIQSQSCHTDRCPTGVATQDPTRQRALVVPDKLDRVANFHAATIASLAELTAAAGLDHPQEFRPEHFLRRVSGSEAQFSSSSGMDALGLA